MNFGKKGTSTKKAKVSKKKSAGKKFAVIFFRTLLVCVVLAIIGGGIVAYNIYQDLVAMAPDLNKIEPTPTGFLSTVLDREGNQTAQLVAEGSNRIYVPLSEIPLWTQEAFVAIEDERFYTNNGIDLRGIVRAGFNYVTSGRTEGASTITQQLIKNNLFEGWVSGESTMDRVERKVQEWYLATELTKIRSKDWILENYLNTINLGQNTLGVQAASRRYFGKDVSQLNLSESAVIACITQNPTRWNPISNPDNNKARRQVVLDNMLRLEFVTQGEYDEAIADDPYARIQQVNIELADSNTRIFTYFVDSLLDQLELDLQESLGFTRAQAIRAIFQGGLTIETTQDPAIQAVVDEEINNPENYPSTIRYSLTYRLTVNKEDGSVVNYSEQSPDFPGNPNFRNARGNPSLNFPSTEAVDAAVEEFKSIVIEEGDTIPAGGEVLHYSPQQQGAITIIDNETGEVRALSGGRGEKVSSRSLNRASQTTRQPGSTFKPLAAYAPAVDAAGKTLGSVQDDAFFTYTGGQEVRNDSRTFRGLINMREALTSSINVYAVKTINDITPLLGYDYLVKFGFSTLRGPGANPNDVVQALPLGGITDGVKNLEMTAAFETFANAGVYKKPRLYTRILDHDGNVLLDNTLEQSTVLKESTAFLITDVLKDAMRIGTGGAAVFPGMTFAGKTGTSNGQVDLWFAGITPYYSAAVWGGYDDGSPQLQNNQSILNYTRNIWRAVMQRLHTDLPNKDFDIPRNGINSATICRKSGKLPIEGVCALDPRGSMVTSELFFTGTTPTDLCDHHVGLTICSVSGLPANEYCPEDVRVTQVYIVGGSEGTPDTPFLLSEEFANSRCNVHGPGMEAPPPPTEETPPVDPGIGGSNTPDTGTPGGGYPDGEEVAP